MRVHLAESGKSRVGAETRRLPLAVGESRVQILAWHFAGEGARATFKSKKEKAAEISLNSLYLSRRRPTLPHTFACSTIGPARLNFRVRDGNGWNPRGKITDKLIRAKREALDIQRWVKPERPNESAHCQVQNFKDPEDEAS
jgi:hypothetical protein